MVYVEWVDSIVVSAEWEDAGDLVTQAEESLGPIAAAGLLLADGKEGIVLALCYSAHSGNAAATVAIPRRAITRQVELRPGHDFPAEASA